MRWIVTDSVAQVTPGWNAGKLSIRKTAIQALDGTVPARGVRDTDAQYAAALNQALTAAFNARQKATTTTDANGTALLTDLTAGTLTPSELRARRESLGLSQSALGEYLGTAQAAISMYEKGRRRIPDTISAQLALLEGAAAALTDRMVETALNLAHEQGPLYLITHTSDDAFWQEHPEHEGLPAVIHRVAAARARAELIDEGIDVRIVAQTDTP